jgi:hypothetical protein
MSAGFDPPTLAALRNFDATQCTEPERETVVRLAQNAEFRFSDWKYALTTAEQAAPGNDPAVQKKDSVTVTPIVVKYTGFTARPNAAGLHPRLLAIPFRDFAETKIFSEGECLQAKRSQHV